MIIVIPPHTSINILVVFSILLAQTIKQGLRTCDKLSESRKSERAILHDIHYLQFLLLLVPKNNTSAVQSSNINYLSRTLIT